MASGMVACMITEWHDGDYIYWTAEVYPNSGNIIAKEDSLAQLLKKLSTNNMQAKILKSIR